MWYDSWYKTPKLPHIAHSTLAKLCVGSSRFQTNKTLPVQCVYSHQAGRHNSVLCCCIFFAAVRIIVDTTRRYAGVLRPFWAPYYAHRDCMGCVCCKLVYKLP
jgi:hypothetical protein